MLKWIEKTRKKPKAVRDQYAFFGALTVTGLIALVWFVSLPSHFADVEVAGEDERQAVGAFSRFLSDAKSNIAAVFSTVPENEQPATSTQGHAGTSSENIVMPDLSEENISTAREKQKSVQKPEPRRVLIATTSRASTSTTTD